MKDLNVGHYAMGDRYANILGAGLANEGLQNLKSVSLKNNRLTGSSMGLLTQSLPKKVTNLNLEGNKIGRKLRTEASLMIYNLMK